MQHYQPSPEYNPILGAVSRRLRRQSPPSARDFLVREGWNLGNRQVEVWFRTKGCHYFLHGGCTMCNYGYSDLRDPMAPSAFAASALETLTLDDATNLLVSPSGSFLDPWEVTPAARTAILHRVAALPWRQFGFETQANFVSEAVLAEMRAGIGGRPLKIAIGLESFDETVRRLCINKDLPQHVFMHAIQAAGRQDVQTSVNVVIGAPFLDTARQIEDTIETAIQLAALKVDEIFLFPINVKVGTLVAWLWNKGFYNPPSLWALLHIVLSVPGAVRSKLSFAWHKDYYDDAAEVASKVLHRPATVDCYKAEMMEASYQLDAFLETNDVGPLRGFAERAQGYQDWLRAMDRQRERPDPGRVVGEMVDDVLGTAFAVRSREEIAGLVSALDALATTPARTLGSAHGG